MESKVTFLNPLFNAKVEGSATQTLSISCKRVYRMPYGTNNAEGHEQVVYYLSRVLNSTETRYTPIEKLCLALYFACTKLRHYLIKSQVYVVSQTD